MRFRPPDAPRAGRSPATGRPAFREGFTLVELLVAVSVFVLLLVLFSNFVFTTSSSAMRENRKMDSLSDARQALDNFALDWSARVRRPDVGMTFTSNSISFLTQMRSYSGSRQLAAVSWQTGTNLALQRGILGYNWMTSDPAPDNNPMMVYPSSPSPTPSITPVIPASSDYDNVSDDVFSMQVSFLGTNGFSTGLTSTNSSSVVSTNITGVVITVATLDQQNRKLLSTAQLSSLAQALNSPLSMASVTNTISPLSVWQRNVTAPGFASGLGLPQQAASAVRVYQRIYNTGE